MASQDEKEDNDASASSNLGRKSRKSNCTIAGREAMGDQPAQRPSVGPFRIFFALWLNGIPPADSVAQEAQHTASRRAIKLSAFFSVIESPAPARETVSLSVINRNWRRRTRLGNLGVGQIGYQGPWLSDKN
jgi:hypothetical protein